MPVASKKRKNRRNILECWMSENLLSLWKPLLNTNKCWFALQTWKEKKRFPKGKSWTKGFLWWVYVGTLSDHWWIQPSQRIAEQLLYLSQDIGHISVCLSTLLHLSKYTASTKLDREKNNKRLILESLRHFWPFIAMQG